MKIIFKAFIVIHFRKHLLRSIMLSVGLAVSAILTAQIVLVDQCSGAPATGAGSTSFGPMYSVATANASSRTAIIYPASQLTALVGQTITSTYFYRLTATGAMAGAPNFKIYFKEVTNSDWGDFFLSWPSTITGATLVYNGNPASAVGTSSGWKNFVSATNFVYSGTKNLAVLMEYVNTSASANIEWVYEYSGNCINPNNFNTLKYRNNNTGTPENTLTSAGGTRPYIGFDIATSCYPPTNVTVPSPNITTSIATVFWAAPAIAPAGGYEYYYGINAATPSASTTPSGATAAGVTTKNLTGLLPSTAYNVWVRAVCGTNDKSPWTNKQKFSTLLSNDESTGAIALTVNPTTACAVTKAGVTYGATQSPDAPSGCFDFNSIEDVWYKFVATNSWHIISFSNVSSGAMIAGLYTGSIESLQPVTCIQTTSPNAKNLVVGQTYYIRAYTYPPNVGPIIQADFNICVSTAPPPPVNDDCANAISIAVNPSTICTSVTAGTLLSATPSPGPTSACGVFEDDVWYKFIATKTSHIITLQNVSGATTNMAFQVLSNCGANNTLLCSNPETNVVDGLIPGNTYYVRVASFGSFDGAQVTFDICIASPADMVYTSSTTFQSSTTSVNVGSVDQPIIRVGVNVSGAANALTLTQLSFNTNGSTSPANIANAKVYFTGTSFSFSNAVQFGNTVASPNGAFTVNGSQILVGGISSAINNFWLVFDIPCNATVGNVVDAECTSLTVSSPRTPTITAPIGSRAINAATTTATVTQATTAFVAQGATNAQILAVTANGCANANVTSLNFTTTGSTNAATSLVGAKVFYTSNTTFATTSQFGTAIVNPNGTFVVTGSQPIATGTGYFWLVYDIAATATIGNVVDATCTAVVINAMSVSPASPAPFGARPVVASLVNDDAPGAVLLTVGSNCFGAIYSNDVATSGPGEPYPSCSGAAAAPVWFKFVAPPSGAVRISTDVGSGNSLSDSKIALFSATNVNDYSSFNILGCDEDGGHALGFGKMSVLYSTDLTPGSTYYVAVDESFFPGTFCITVAELTSSMLSLSNTCANSSQPIFASGGANNYSGWLSLLDQTSKLIALVKSQPGFAPGLYKARQNIHSGPVRNSSGTFYLNRSFSIDHPSASNVQMKLFFLNTELAALTTVDPSVNLSNLSSSKQSNGGTTCFGTFNTANGSISTLPQTESGTSGGASWITVNSPSLSNFYLNKIGSTLPVSLVYFNGKKGVSGNQLSWKVNCTTGGNKFGVERSENGVAFIEITTIYANIDRCATPFEVADTKPLNGLNYYRLKMEDADGKITYSQVVAINNRNVGFEVVGLFPSAVYTETLLYIAAAKAGKMQVVISDMTGKQLQIKNIIVVEGENKILFNCGALAAGVYNMVCLSEDGKSNIRFMKY